MAEMKISNTLVNDDSSQIIAYAEQIVDRVNYLNLKLNNPTLRVLAGALDRLRGEFDTLVGDPSKMEGVIDTFKEIGKFLEEVAPGTTLNDILLPLSFGVIAIDIDPLTGIVTATAPNDKIALNTIKSKINPETGEVAWEGSARGYDKSALTDFRKWLLENTPQIMYAEGHENAFGVGIREADFQDFEETLYAGLREFDFSLVYKVDAIFQADDFRGEDIVEVGGLKTFWGKMIDEPYIAIERIKLTPQNTQLMSKDKSPTLKITLPNGVTLIKFGFSEEEYNELVAPMMTTTINVVGQCRQNIWGGRVTGQIEIEDFEITNKEYDF